MNHPDVPWHRLPEDPAGFFGLSGPLDRTQLRRRYSALIRRFKPEQHPEEFQKIRAAYEMLDSMLRYGRSISPDANHGWPGEDGPISIHVSPGPEDAEDAEAEEPSGVEMPWGPSRILEAVEEGSPDAAYQAIQGLPARLPFHFGALALLSDVVNDPGESGETFGAWLLEGLREHPEDHGLASLFAALTREPIPAAEARVLIRRAHDCLTDDSFYFLTEPLWLTLARSIPFPEWRDLLEELEDRRPGVDSEGRQVFTVRLVRALLFKADEAWIRERLAWLLDHGLELPEWCSHELDELDVLDRYRRGRAVFLNGDPLRDRLDRVIRAWVEEDEAEADRRFLACQQDFVERRPALLRAFAPPQPEFEPVVWPYLMRARDVASRVLEEPEPFLASQVEGSTRNRAWEMLKSLEKRTDHSWIGWVWHGTGLGYMLGLGALHVAGVAGSLTGLSRLLGLVSARLASSLQAVVLVAGVVASILLVHFVVRRRILRPLFERFSAVMARVAYRRIWRREVVKLIEETHVSSLELESAVAAVEDKDITNDDWLQMMMHEDHGLFFYAVALRFAG